MNLRIMKNICSQILKEYSPKLLASFIVCSLLLITNVFNISTASINSSENNFTDSDENNTTLSVSAVGGGKGYRGFVSQRDYFVEAKDELLDALAAAENGEVVYISDTAVIDMTGEEGVLIPGGVTLASGRGKKGSKGALLFSDKLRTYPLFLIAGDGVRITGLRIRGPDPDRRTAQMKALLKQGKYYSIPNSRGISSSHADLEVDNCELSGWSHAAIHLVSGARNAHIHHNYIHHNQRYGLGYGVVLDEADALIEANIFDWNRHSIAGTGRPGTSYEARYNLVLENANSHSFDMHGGKDRKDGTNIAGTWIKIHHNIFQVTSDPAIKIRGVPLVGVEIYNNCFFHKNEQAAILQTNAQGKFIQSGNEFGTCQNTQVLQSMKLPPDLFQGFYKQKIK